MRPGRYFAFHALRPVLQARRFPHRSDPAGRTGADHARPFRSCARRATARCSQRRKRWTSCACAMARISPARTQAISYGESFELGRRTCQLPSGRPRARLGADPRRMRTALRIVASGDYKDVADPTCAPFELMPAMSSSPKRRSGCRFSATPIAVREIGKLLRSVALFPERAHLVGAYTLGKAQRAHRAAPQRRLRQADLPARRDGSDHALLPGARHRSWRGASWCAAPRRPSFAGTIALCPPMRLQRSLVAAFSRSGLRVCIGMDARARTRAPARRQAAARHFRPRRLGRTDAHDRGDRRLRSLGDARPGGRAGALVPVAKVCRRGRSISSAMATKRKPTSAAPARPRHEPLCRTARSPRL